MTEEQEDGVLSEDQSRFLETVAQEGYFEVPREITLRELANKHGISSQEASESLRDAFNILVTKEVPGD